MTWGHYGEQREAERIVEQMKREQPDPLTDILEDEEDVDTEDTETS